MILLVALFFGVALVLHLMSGKRADRKVARMQLATQQQILVATAPPEYWIAKRVRDRKRRNRKLLAFAVLAVVIFAIML